MRSLAICLALALAGAAAAAAQEATIKEIVGEVEVKAGGAAEFSEAKVGTKLKSGDFVSTGFDSTAVLSFEGDSEVTVSPLTQLRIDEFLKGAARDKTQIFLRVGTVQAKVKHEAAIRSDFSVVTPTCTASVRGSEQRVTYLPGFGTTVEYLEGLGLAQDARGQATSMRANDTVKASTTGKLASPQETARAAASADLAPSGSDNRERAATNDYGRVAIRPETDPTNPNSIVDRIGAANRGSTLIFRYELLGFEGTPTNDGHSIPNSTSLGQLRSR